MEWRSVLPSAPEPHQTADIFGKIMIYKAITMTVLLCAVVPFAAGSNQEHPARIRSYKYSCEDVYAATVQVVGTGYNLKAAVKEGHTVTFYTGGRYSFVLSAVCRESDLGSTIVLSVFPAEGNPQVFLLQKPEDKETVRFFSALDLFLLANRPPESKGEAKPAASQSPAPSATISIQSTPAGADIMIDGKFVGQTPSAIHVSIGSHVIRIEKSGCTTWERSIELSSGENTTLSPSLEMK